MIHPFKILRSHNEERSKNIQRVLTITDWTGHLHFNQQEISVCNQEVQLVLVDLVVSDRSLLKPALSL